MPNYLPNYDIPGTAASRHGSRIVGVIAVVTVVVLGLAWHSVLHRPEADRIRIQLRTTHIGEGIVAGTTVRLDDVPVGTVAAVVPVGADRQLLTLELDRAQTSGLTDTVTVDYAPENLFGISTVALHPAAGGTPLRPDAVIDVADRVNDVTMGTLLRRLTQTSTEVLTPELTGLLTQFSTDMQAFGPMLRALVTLSRAVADTQRYAPSYLIDQYAAFFGGLGAFSSSSFRLLDAILRIEVFRNDRPKYDASINMITDRAFPAIGEIGDVSGNYYRPATDMLAPLLAAVAKTVPAPQVSRAELSELIDRLGHTIADTPNGPAADIAVALRGVPAVAIPLLGRQALTTLPEPGGIR
ncbi:MlaD family protein [Nocardia terpenica]|uniref:Mammalian cell entry protein n=1 Tax=Nocardia terpenica TaxID=455432 RepID=A0A6G9ZEF9_9NOCA|nr:MlaD family protein [Nocardia terpenica]QIS23383.1 mammalian cell entry protein [Nocardia terpenica]